MIDLSNSMSLNTSEPALNAIRVDPVSKAEAKRGKPKGSFSDLLQGVSAFNCQEDIALKLKSLEDSTNIAATPIESNLLNYLALSVPASPSNAESSNTEQLLTKIQAISGPTLAFGSIKSEVKNQDNLDVTHIPNNSKVTPTGTETNSQTNTGLIQRQNMDQMDQFVPAFQDTVQHNHPNDISADPMAKTTASQPNSLLTASGPNTAIVIANDLEQHNFSRKDDIRDQRLMPDNHLIKAPNVPTGFREVISQQIINPQDRIKDLVLPNSTLTDLKVNEVLEHNYNEVDKATNMPPNISSLTKELSAPSSTILEPLLTSDDTALDTSETSFVEVLGQQVKQVNSTNLDNAEISNPEQQPYDQYQIKEQIVDHARLQLNQHNSEMVIKLRPEHLGDVTLKVTVENGNVTATFHADQPEVRGIIESSLQQLKQELSNQGLKVDHVGVYSGLQQFFANDQREQRQQFIAKDIKKGVAEFSALEEEAEPLNSPSLSGIDYRI